MKGLSTFSEAFAFIAHAGQLEEYTAYLAGANASALPPGLMAAWQAFCSARQEDQPMEEDDPLDARE